MQIFKFAVKWNFAIQLDYDSADFKRGITNTKLPFVFVQQEVHIWFLHNMSISFICHLVIFIIFIVLKIWDLIGSSIKNFLYNIYVLFDLTFVIVGYLFVHL